MNKLITLSTSTAVLSGLLIMTGCSSDGGGGPAVPASAVAIDANNAHDIVQAAMAAAISINDGAEFNTDFVTCFPGTSSSTVTTSINGATFVESGTVTLVDCGIFISIIPDTYLIDGPLTYSESFTINPDLSGSFNQSTSGSVGITTVDDSVSVTGYAFNVTGTESFLGDDTWSATVQFSYDSLTLGNGFAAQTTVALAGSGDTCPTSGVVLVTGATSSQAKGTFQADGLNVLIEYNTGDGVFTTDTTYPCGEFMN